MTTVYWCKALKYCTSRGNPTREHRGKTLPHNSHLFDFLYRCTTFNSISVWCTTLHFLHLHRFSLSPLTLSPCLLSLSESESSPLGNHRTLNLGYRWPGVRGVARRGVIGIMSGLDLRVFPVRQCAAQNAHSQNRQSIVRSALPREDARKDERGDIGRTLEASLAATRYATLTETLHACCLHPAPCTSTVSGWLQVAARPDGLPAKPPRRIFWIFSGFSHETKFIGLQKKKHAPTSGIRI